MSSAPPEQARAYMRDYMRRYRHAGSKQPTSWTEERLTERWEDRKARRARERQQDQQG